jgi:hypothetical protein
VARDSTLDAFRQKGVLLVHGIELFRRGHVEKAGAVLAELESRGLGVWRRIQLTLAFAGREPWGGYPYPDY